MFLKRSGLLSDLIFEFNYSDYLFYLVIILLYIILYYIDFVSPKGPYLAGAACCTYLCFG